MKHWFLLDGIIVDRAWVAIDQRAKGSAYVPADTAESCLAIGYKAGPRTEQAADGITSGFLVETGFMKAGSGWICKCGDRRRCSREGRQAACGKFPACCHNTV